LRGGPSVPALRCARSNKRTTHDRNLKRRPRFWHRQPIPVRTELFSLRRPGRFATDVAVVVTATRTQFFATKTFYLEEQRVFRANNKTRPRLAEKKSAPKGRAFSWSSSVAEIRRRTPGRNPRNNHPYRHNLRRNSIQRGVASTIRIDPSSLHRNRCRRQTVSS
jgi:hypothetical protein